MTGAPESGSGAPPAARGVRYDAAEPVAFAAALRAVVDYRGDVTITLATGAAPIVGYVFDGGTPRDREHAVLRLLPADGGPRVAVPLRDVTAIELTGRDTAAGRSFESWVRRYVERKLAGETASIESEPLDEA